MDTSNSRPLRVVVLYSGGHLGSAIILNRLLQMPEYQVVGLVKAQSISASTHGTKKLREHFNKLGWRFAWLLAWQRTIQALGFHLTSIFPGREQRLQPAWRLAKDHDIPLLEVNNINSDAEAFIKRISPDMLISAYFPQILKPHIISLPARGVLNIHPGWLPAYKGAMSYFWVLKNGSHKAGVTVHWIDEGIDTGEVIARKSFPITKKMTQENVLVMTAVLGSKLLQQVGKQLLKGDLLKPVKSDPEECDSYYPLPGESDFDEYFRQRRFFRIRDVLGILFKRQIHS